MKASPPTSDYVANEFESNPELQKVLYYGYGGPGDITGEYMPSFDWKTKYIFTHLAAAYSYCGMDGFMAVLLKISRQAVYGDISSIFTAWKHLRQQQSHYPQRKQRLMKAVMSSVPGNLA